MILEQESIFLGEVQKMAAKIIDFEDKTVRVALVKMGWTPPCANFTRHEESVCLECDGEGGHMVDDDYYQGVNKMGGETWVECKACHGTGRVTNED